MPNQSSVTLFFRKPRARGNYSIETAFDQIMASFPADGPFCLRKFVSSHFSNGIVPRTKAIMEARRNHDTINHVTGDVHYLALGLPRDRTVLTVHDCGMIDRATNPLTRTLLKWIWLDLPVRHCNTVTADSIATRDDIIRLTGCNADKIAVVPVCISGRFSRRDATFNDRCPRILHIGTAYNKNLSRHIEALSDIDCHLHIIGAVSDEDNARLQAHAIKHTIEDNVEDEDILRAYAECDMLLFASTLEGFGMPILEAQTVGRPVVTANLSSMPEIAGDAARLVDPFDVASIREGVQEVIASARYRQTLLENGYKNLERFRPAKIAQQFAQVYARVAATADAPLDVADSLQHHGHQYAADNPGDSDR